MNKGVGLTMEVLIGKLSRPHGKAQTRAYHSIYWGDRQWAPEACCRSASNKHWGEIHRNVL